MTPEPLPEPVAPPALETVPLFVKVPLQTATRIPPAEPPPPPAESLEVPPEAPPLPVV